VRLAQDFAQRYPLVDGQGNFGNVDGDSAAAMRYTEARLTETARLLLDGLDDDTVDFRPTYDGSEIEPVVLPAAVPHLLANGSAGIAVGMATSIPPHNMAELLDAATHLIDNRQATTRDLLKIVKGPDFPTGGIIVDDKAAIREAYETGRGGFRVRAKWHVEEGARGAWVCVVTEIPYQVAKSRLIEKIAELLDAKKLPLLADVRDESTEDIRVVLEPKSRNVEPSLLMESLFKLTELESRFPLNMNVLVGGQVPKVVGLADLLREWLDHRRTVLLRRSQHRLGEIGHRLEVLGGYLIAYLNIDKVIKIIRTHDDPKAELIRVFKLTDVQATAILDMRLRSLRKLEEIEIRSEHDALTAEKAELERLLESEPLQWRAIGSEIAKVRESYDPKSKLGRRRTVFGAAPEHDEEAVQEALMEREPITVILSEKGWIRALKGHQEDVSGLTFKTDDRLKLAFYAETTSKIMVFATNGRFYTLEAAKLPGGRGHGEPIRLFLEMEQADDVVDAFVYEGGRKFLVASREARGFVVAEDDCLATTRKGKQVLVVDAPDEARLVTPVTGDSVATIGENRRLLVFPLNQVPEMPRGKGVRLQRFGNGGLSAAKCFTLADGLTWIDAAERTYTVEKRELREWIGNRSDAGRLPPKGFPKSNKFE
jgi:topoisomerase-4 subunit A